MGGQTLTDKADRWAGWAAVALGFSIPISTALDEILLVVILALWLVGGSFSGKDHGGPRATRSSFPRCFCSGCTSSGFFYGDATGVRRWVLSQKAANLLFIPILLFFFREERVRRLALAGFLAALALMILISYLLWMGIMPPHELFHITPDDAYTPFKHRITHSFLMAFGAYLFALKARLERRGPLRILFAVLSVAALVNVLFIVSGRTGYVVVLVARPLFPYRRMALAGRRSRGGRARGSVRRRLPDARFGSPSADCTDGR